MKPDKLRNRKPIGTEVVQIRMIVAFAIIVLLFIVLALRIGYIQVIATDLYASRAAENQTKDYLIQPKRGSVYDRNMKEMAVSTSTYTIWVRLKPYNIKAEPDPAQQQAQFNAASDILAEALGMPKDDIDAMFVEDNSRVKVAKGVTKEQMEIISAGIDERGVTVIEPEENSSREYPLGEFAAHILGSVSSDGIGRSGIELEYNEYLSGIAGRSISRTDRDGNPLSTDDMKVYEKTDGLNVVLTIDETIQYYAEKALDNVMINTEAHKASCIIMDPKTGDILAMAAKPDFDPNQPSVPIGDEAKAAFELLNDDEQMDYLNSVWRNPMTTDLYEPGSVFKLVTVSSALEEGVITPQTEVNCAGVYQVADRSIKCWNYPRAHGTQSVREAVGNSCNPAMMQVIQRMGYDKFYQYMELYGITTRTGVDFPGEAAPLIQDKQTAVPVGLATMSFGQGLSITPLQMINAVAAIGNEGKLMQPRLVRGLSDSDGNMVEEFPTHVIRQVISKQTAEETMEIMEYVAREAGGQIASVPGYRVGSKTGTGQKLVDGVYLDDIHKVVGSMVAMAPMEDPQFVVFVAVDEPQIGQYGSTTAGPGVHEIMEELLRYLDIKPHYTEEELAELSADMKTVPDLTGKAYSEAAGILLAEELTSSVNGGSTAGDFTIKDQYPKPGTEVPKNTNVVIYR